MPPRQDPRGPDLPPDLLEKYRKMRSADRTPEPFGGRGGGERPLLFVVQRHDARRLHYDLRLEHRGVLMSWAVPRGPSLDPADKRMAVHVEDHPIDYGDFEGVIPPGNYGAGTVVLWDQGHWVPLEDPDEGMKKGKLLFELHGYKLRGVWQLVRTKRKGGAAESNEWLFIKKPDAHSRTTDPEPFPQESILSGLTNDDLEAGRTTADAVRADLAASAAPRAAVDVATVSLMLAETADAPFTRKNWIFELKYDGYRMLAAKQEGRARLVYRRGSDVSAMYPEVARAVAALPAARLVLDGEIVVLGPDGRPSFQLLQRLAQSRHRAHTDTALVMYVFDLLGFEDFDLRPLPLLRRKELLRRLLPRAGPLRYADHVEERGEELYEQVSRMGIEGLMAKKADAPYKGGRWAHWLKLRVDRTDDFAVVGYTVPKGVRAGFGSLHLAVRDGERWLYAGRVGSGFDERELAAVKETLDTMRVRERVFVGTPPRGAGDVWVEPRLVCSVRYKEWTDDGMLRHPVFIGFRSDKDPRDCVRPRAVELPPDEPRRPPPPAPPPQAPVEKVVPFSNLAKVFWPAEGYTKGDLIEYYRAVAPRLLPYLTDRLVVMTRYPDGIEGKSFFQKDAPSFAPGWVRTERMWSEHAQREIDYFVCEQTESLLYLINLGTIPLHIWSSRVATIARPDWCILDLDPKGAPFAHVITIARAIKALCDDIQLPSYVKTTGSTGLHVLLPLGQAFTFEQCKSFGELLARLVAAELPDIATTARVIADRGGRVYVDFLQNGHGKLIVSPYSVRPLPGAPVSTPLEWSEVKEGLSMGDFTIRTVPERFARMKDPMVEVITAKPDLARALERLGARQPRKA